MPLERRRSSYLCFNERKISNEEIMRMYYQMVNWLAINQEQNCNHEYHGAIWCPNERRYDNRDTGCSVLAFWRMYQLTGQQCFLNHAEIARHRTLQDQEEDGGYAELTLEQKRIDEGSLVNTGLIADSLIRAYRSGFSFGQCDIDALKRMADFILTLEWASGGFYHDEGHISRNTHMDCQNTTAEAGMVLAHIYSFIVEQGSQPREEWIQAANRTIPRIKAGQEDTGQWPYLLGMIDSYPHDMVHQSMMMIFVGEIYRYFRDAELIDFLVRGAEWLIEDEFLHTSHGTKHNWRYEFSACCYFSYSYFQAAAAMAQLATLDSQRSIQWKREAYEIMRYLRTDLWNTPPSKEGPFKLTEAGLERGYSWHGESMGWCTYLMDHFLVDLSIAFGKVFQS